MEEAGVRHVPDVQYGRFPQGASRRRKGIYNKGMHLLEYPPEKLQAWCVEQGLPGYRASQVWRWIGARGATSFEQMTDLPVPLRARLAECFQIESTRLVTSREADDGTRKLLLSLGDGNRIECVLLCDDRGHHAICLSTQVGCAMGCVFCASGLSGVERNLHTGEIIEQMLQLQRLLPPPQRVSHVVVMGMGEPLANLPALMPALAVASSPAGFGISPRR
jgi:23S rRNA (adenine2503-C2)-methyltransferase